MKRLKLAISFIFTLLLSACVTEPPLMPTAEFAPVMPIPEPKNEQVTGGIYSNGRGLFGSLRSYQPSKLKVGDILTVLLSESTQASRSSELKTTRESENDVMNANLLSNLAAKVGVGPALSANVNPGGGTISTDGSGVAGQAAALTGSISAMVVEVFSNGNLMIVGEKINDFIKPVWKFLNEQITKNKNILFEGAQGFYLDLDHGTYPYVTSSNTVPANASIGSGFNPLKFKKILGITKAYTTRVGNGPFPTEESNEIGEMLGKIGKEFGTVTGRKRRCGWLDVLMLKQAIIISGINSLVLTKLDVLDTFKEIKICTKYKINEDIIDYYPSNGLDQMNVTPVYETLKGWVSNTKGIKSFSELPNEAKTFIKKVEMLVNCRIQIISTGPERNDTIILEDVFN